MNKSNKLLEKLLLIIVSAQTILMGIIFIVQVLRIYFGNNKVYTLNICSKYLLQMLPIIIIWLVLIIVAYIYCYVKNIKFKEHTKATNYAKYQLLLYNMPTEETEEFVNEYTFLKQEKQKRLIAYLINGFILLICSIMGLCYLLNIKHFNPEGDQFVQARNLLIHLLPWALISLASSIGLIIYDEASYKKSCDVLKYIITNSNNKEQKIYTTNKKKNLIINIVRIVVIVIAVALIIDGITNGGASEVLRKAEAICKECIGMG